MPPLFTAWFSKFLQRLARERTLFGYKSIHFGSNLHHCEKDCALRPHRDRGPRPRASRRKKPAVDRLAGHSLVPVIGRKRSVRHMFRIFTFVRGFPLEILRHSG